MIENPLCLKPCKRYIVTLCSCKVATRQYWALHNHWDCLCVTCVFFRCCFTIYFIIWYTTTKWPVGTMFMIFLSQASLTKILYTHPQNERLKPEVIEVWFRWFFQLVVLSMLMFTQKLGMIQFDEHMGWKHQLVVFSWTIDNPTNTTCWSDFFLFGCFRGFNHRTSNI